MGARLVGIGRSTKGLEHLLAPGEIIVIGRHDDCTIPLTRPPIDEDAGVVSRQHAILEEVAPGRWCVYDTGSLNGCAVLRAGLPPARELSLGEKYVLEHDDVIELAGSQNFQFVYHDTEGGDPNTSSIGGAEVTQPVPRAQMSMRAHERPRDLSDLLLDAARVTIGTAADNDCRLIDPSVSRHHALMWREGRSLFVRDLQSLNGTTINGSPLTGVQQLEPQAQLTFGQQRFVVDAQCWAPQAGRASVDLRLIDVCVEVAGKLRLRDLSFGVRQGEMVGLLGPSASGKSTLLKVLAGRLRIARGSFYINGRRMDSPDARWGWLKSLMGITVEDYHVGFVQQHDLVQPGLTVREMLEYAAMHMGVGTEGAAARAVDAATRCNLTSLLDRIVQDGDGRLNLSGGQLKRVCVALEVLRQPKVLLLDEPTTGQDPKNTRDQMNVFRALSRAGATTIISTHDIHNLEMFDAIGILCLGRLVYYGPPASFAKHFGFASPEAVYATLPDREERSADADALVEAFHRTPFYTQHCQVDP